MTGTQLARGRPALALPLSQRADHVGANPRCDPGVGLAPSVTAQGTVLRCVGHVATSGEREAGDG